MLYIWVLIFKYCLVCLYGSCETHGPRKPTVGRTESDRRIGRADGWTAGGEAFANSSSLPKHPRTRYTCNENWSLMNSSKCWSNSCAFDLWDTDKRRESGIPGSNPTISIPPSSPPPGHSSTDTKSPCQLTTPGGAKVLKWTIQVTSSKMSLYPSAGIITICDL